jgi:hypothetical protein
MGIENRNGPSWHLMVLHTDIDRSTARVRWEMSSHRADAGAPLASIAPAALVRRALAFYRRNADLIGLTDPDFQRLKWAVHEGWPRIAAGWGWSGSASTTVRESDRAHRPYELSHDVTLSFDFGRDGELLSVQANLSRRSTCARSMC